MTTRAISGLRWARPIDRPNIIPVGRPRGAKAAGLRYERALAEALPSALHGQWFEFEDANGHGYCQTDFILSFLPRYVVVLECKYIVTTEAVQQLLHLYLPIAREVYGMARGVIVAKKLVPGFCRNAFGDLESAISAADVMATPVWHWLGRAVPALRAA